MTKILLVDDSALITSGLKIILESVPEFEVVGVCSSGDEAILFCAQTPVDIILMDVRMPGMNGVEATGYIHQHYKILVIILTTFDEDNYIIEGIKNRASGYLLKTTSPDLIIHGIQTVLKGQSILSKEVLEKAAKLTTSEQKSPDIQCLTEREQEVAHLVAKGLTNKEIAAKLFLSEGTVHNSLSIILRKLALEHRTQLAIYLLTGEVGE